jgi:hypothetical protein
MHFNFARRQLAHAFCFFSRTRMLGGASLPSLISGDGEAAFSLRSLPDDAPLDELFSLPRFRPPGLLADPPPPLPLLSK